MSDRDDIRGRPWRSLAERDGGEGLPDAHGREFPEGASEPPDVGCLEGVSRRRFLGLAAATAALGGATACSGPGSSVVPYTRRPEEIVPGVANWYATSFQEGSAVHPVLVKTREGRPIHIEGNDLHPASGGATSARTPAQVLGLYDPERLRRPVVSGAETGWEEALLEVQDALRESRAASKEVLLLTGAVLSPGRRAAIEELRRAVPTLRHVEWEPTAGHAARKAAVECLGEAVAPRPRLDRASVVVALECDFLGCDDGSPRTIAGFAEGRKISRERGEMLRLYAVEGRMSLTGSNADVRIPLRPTAAASFAFALARELHGHGVALPRGVGASALGKEGLADVASRAGLDAHALEGLVADLAAARGRALVQAGPSLPAAAHAACHLLNAMLLADGSTLEWSAATEIPATATPAEMGALATDMAAGRVGAALLWDVNPSYALPDAAGWKDALAKVPFRAALSLSLDETAQGCPVALPLHHWMESWGDYKVSPDAVTLQQPVLSPLHDTRQGEDVILSLAAAMGGGEAGTYLDLLKGAWRDGQLPAGSPVPFGTFWNAVLHDGFHRPRARAGRAPALRGAAITRAAGAAAGTGGELELLLHPDSRVYDGRLANNGWLQELPEAVSKQVWGNAVALSVADAERLGLEDGDLAEIEAGGAKARLPVVVQPGQASGVASAALGFGREAGSVATAVGTNLYPLAGKGESPYLRGGVKISRAGRRSTLVRTQEHHSLHGRDHARHVGLEEYRSHGLPHHAHFPDSTLYPEVEYPGHKWAMAVDLNACVGCGGCVMACQSENNIPVVGPEQVERGREMHWIRIDRYYEGDPANPLAIHQPMLCQHCDLAPCENVCPVNATTHSEEGLNQMAYNRCVGTRYCANNCPYKVRRFNFFDLHADLREPQQLAFNPEVSIRPRGVMEKCTFCVQRIQDAKQRAKGERRALSDGDVRPACAAACPANAIVFGDGNDEGSAVASEWKSDRGYRVLEELGVSPAIVYLARVRNAPDGGSGEGGSHGGGSQG